MHAGCALVADAQTLEAMRPSLHLFGHVAIDAQAAVPCACWCRAIPGRDATGTQFLTQLLAVVGAVWTLAGPTQLAASRRDGID